MTITEELIKSNGAAKTVAAQSITLSSGITVRLNRQPGDIMGKAQAAAERDLEDSRPAVPTQSMETEPNVWRDIPNEHNPEYIAAMSEWRRPGSRCAGGIVLSWKDLWPGAGWGLLDSRGAPKAPWYALRRVLDPLALLVTDEGLSGLALHVVNDHPQPFEGSLRLAAFSGDALIIW